MRCKLCGQTFERPAMTGDGFHDPRQFMSPCCWGDYWETDGQYRGGFADAWGAHGAFDLMRRPVTIAELKEALTLAYEAGTIGQDPHKTFVDNWGEKQ